MATEPLETTEPTGGLNRRRADYESVMPVGDNPITNRQRTIPRNRSPVRLADRSGGLGLAIVRIACPPISLIAARTRAKGSVRTKVYCSFRTATGITATII